MSYELYKSGYPLKLLCVNIWGILHIMSKRNILFSWSNLQKKSIAIPMKGNMPDTIFKVLTKISLKSAFPGPSSTILIFFGLFKLSQKLINQMTIISQNIFEIFGAVIKSPFFPNGFFFGSIQGFYHKELFLKTNREVKI